MRIPWVRKEDASVHVAMGGVATLMVLLLLVTPTLEGGGAPQPGTLLSRGQIVVDYLSNGTAMIYVDSNGHVRFHHISIAVNLSAGSLPRTSKTPLRWDVTRNSTDRVEAYVSIANATDFAINVTTIYVSSSSQSYTVSTGIYGFLVVIVPGGGTLTAYPLSALPTSRPQTWALSSLPQALALSEMSILGSPP